jgi:large subunit ribosomal protein L29
MKASEIRELTKDELLQKLEDLREELFNLRMRNATNNLENPKRIREIKKDIARINTIITEKERQVS